LEIWAETNSLEGPFSVKLLPHSAGSELLELSVFGPGGDKVARVVFATIRDRRGKSILSVRDQETIAETLRNKRLSTLCHLFLIKRYKAESIHYVTPTDDNVGQTKGMQKLGIFDDVNVEIGDIIVARIDQEHVPALLDQDRVALTKLINKEK
jgi:isocitrate lyase